MYILVYFCVYIFTQVFHACFSRGICMQYGGFPRMKHACNAAMPIACTVNPVKFKTLTMLGDQSFAAAPQLWNLLPYAIRSSPSVPSFKKTLKTFLFQKAFMGFYVLFNLIFSKFYAVFYDLSSLIGNFYSFSVDIIVLTLVGRFMHLMHVYFMQSW